MAAIKLLQHKQSSEMKGVRDGAEAEGVSGG